MNKRPLPVTGEGYRHYKTGEVYKVIGIALHTETGEELVIYTNWRKQIFARPVNHFLAPIVNNENGTVYRFTFEPCAGCRNNGSDAFCWAAQPEVCEARKPRFGKGS